MAKVKKVKRRNKPRPAFLQAAREILGRDDAKIIVGLMFFGDSETVSRIEERARELEAEDKGPSVGPPKLSGRRQTKD